MSATAETVADVERLNEKYKYGFVTDIEAENRAQRSERRHGPLHFREERMSLNGCWNGAWKPIDVGLR